MLLPLFMLMSNSGLLDVLVLISPSLASSLLPHDSAWSNMRVTLDLNRSSISCSGTFQMADDHPKLFCPPYAVQHKNVAESQQPTNVTYPQITFLS